MVYGAKCFIDVSEPTRDVNALVQEQGPGVSRVDAANCVDMLADASERDSIAAGKKTYWLTPGWVKNWRYIFKDWDVGKANETFPQNERAVILDAVGFLENYSQEKPGEILAFSDWMRIPLAPHPVSLDRLRALLLDQLERSK